MHLDRFTIKSQEALQAANSLARTPQHGASPEHLLAALLEQGDGVVPPVLRKLGARPDAIRAVVNAASTTLPRSPAARRAQHGAGADRRPARLRARGRQA